ncbi:MAG: ATP-NAD kinase family protein [Cuniculiplasma sp.]
MNPRAGEGLSQRVNGSDSLVENDGDNYSAQRSHKFLENLNRYYTFCTASGKMGEDVLKEASFDNVEIIYNAPEHSNKEDTVNFVREADKKCDIILFAGGDGTAVDILNANPHIPVLGIPSGMKMYSSIFAMNPEEAASLLDDFDRGKAIVVESIVEDADEEKMISGELIIKTRGKLKSIGSADQYHNPKIVTQEWAEDSISEFITDTMDSSYYLIGTGSTCKSIMDRLGIKTSIFSVDLIRDGKILKSNYYPQDLDEYIKEDAGLKIIVSPYAGSGFFLGRGNRQIDERAIRRAGKGNIIVVSSEQKLSSIRGLAFDVDGIDHSFFGKYMKVIVGYERFKMIPLL